MSAKKDLAHFERFVISQAAILIRDNKCLILKASDRDEPKWVLPGGRLDKGEKKDDALDRELQEELGFSNIEVLGVVDYDIWYHEIPHLGIKKFPVCAIANLIADPGDEINISPEHNDMAWVVEDDLDKYDFIWPQAKRMIRRGFEYYRLLNK